MPEHADAAPDLAALRAAELDAKRAFDAVVDAHAATWSTYNAYNAALTAYDDAWAAHRDAALQLREHLHQPTVITIRIVEKQPLSSAYVEYNGVKTKAKRGKDGRLRVTFGFAGRQYIRGQKQTESIAIIGKRRRGGSTVAGTRRYRPCEMKLGHLNGAPFRL